MVKRTNMNKDTRVVLDADFYRLSAIIYSKKYKILTEKILSHFQKLNCPIPKEGFNSVSEYHSWTDKYKEKISNDPDARTPDSLLNSILLDFGLDPKNQQFSLRIYWKFFFNIDRSPTISVNTPKLKWVDNELWIKLPDWTRKTDYESWWTTLEQELLKYPLRRGKDKLKTSFKRDFLLYELYKIKMMEKRNIKRGGSLILEDFWEDPEFKVICKKYGKIDSHFMLKKLILYFNKLLKNVSILDTDKLAV